MYVQGLWDVVVSGVESLFAFSGSIVCVCFRESVCFVWFCLVLFCFVCFGVRLCLLLLLFSFFRLMFGAESEFGSGQAQPTHCREGAVKCIDVV